MAINRLSKKKLIPASHWPSFLLIIGYPVYWLELYVLSKGSPRASLLAPFFFLVFISFQAVRSGRGWRNACKGVCQAWSRLTLFWKLTLGAGCLLSLFILGIGLSASLLPPHLIQEYDVLNYHLTLPRQHLMLNSFAHIPWSMADFYFMPVDFGLAPFWLVTSWPNKFPQFIFVLGVLSVSWRLVRKFCPKEIKAPFVAIFALLGSHAVGIQIGTGMLDLVLCYLFLASLDSLISKNFILAFIEFNFFLWSKSFIPLMMLAIIIGIGAVVFLLKIFGFHLKGWSGSPEEPASLITGQPSPPPALILKRGLLFMSVALLIGGPFVAKSFYYTGTPAYPLFDSLITENSVHNQKALVSLRQKAEECVAGVYFYGSGRSVKEFFRHLWLIAVPEKGVNNRYDYPVGLVYLLCLGPFLAVFAKSLAQRKIFFLPWMVMLYWSLWWMGSHQSRFLIIPLTLMSLIVTAQPFFHRRTFMIGLLIALCFVALSVYRAHRFDLGKSPYDVLRPKDKSLLQRAETVGVGQTVDVDFPDAAFAAFPVNVTDCDSIFVLEYSKSD